MIVILLKIISIVLLADFITGLVHWLEDSYWSLETPILGKWLVEPNLAHHADGQAFLKKSWWESSWDLVLLSFLILFMAYILGVLSWEIGLFTLIIINANQIHKWAHITRKENKPKVIHLLQTLYVLQRTQHHGQHHRKPNNTHFCTVTNLLNPLLNGSGFWRFLESMLGKKSKLLNNI